MIQASSTLDDLRLQPHWSYSAINQFLRICPAQFAFQRECRTVPIGDHLVALLRQLKREQSRRRSPYVFLDSERRDKLVSRWRAGTWQPGEQLPNNVIRNLRALCRRAA